MDPNKEDNAVSKGDPNLEAGSPTPQQPIPTTPTPQQPISQQAIPTQPSPSIAQPNLDNQILPNSLAQPQPKKSSSKKIVTIIIAVIAILLLSGGSIMFVAMRTLQDKASNAYEKNKTNQKEDETEEASNFEQSVSAEYLTDFDEVCKKVATVSNSKSYSKGDLPNVVVLKQSAVSDLFTTMSQTFKDASIKAADYKVPTDVQLVACLTVDETNDVAGVCEAEQNGKKVSLKKTAVTYKLEVFEAKTGKKLGNGAVDGPITDCPLLVYYDQSDPRVYGEPDSVKLESALLSIIN